MTVSTTPAPARTDRAATASSVAVQADAADRPRGSRPLAAMLVAAPLLLAGGIALHPDDTHGVQHTLAAVGGEQQLMWSAIHLLEPVAWMLMGITLLLALPRMASRRGRGLLSTAAVFAAVGFPSIALLVYSHGEAFLFMAATDVPASTYGPLFEQYETGFPLAAIPSMLGRVGLLLAAIGLFRARTVPVWGAALLLVPAFVLGSTGGLPLAIGLPSTFGPVLVVFALIARRVAIGVGGLSVSEVARRTGMRGPSLYKYFPSLHALYDALFARGLAAQIAAVDAAVDGEPPGLARLRAGARAVVRWSTENPALAQLLFWRAVPGFEPSPETFAASVRDMAGVRAELAEAVRLGELRPEADSDDALRLWTVLLSGVISQQLANEPGAPFATGSFTSLTDAALDLWVDRYALQEV